MSERYGRRKPSCHVWTRWAFVASSRMNNTQPTQTEYRLPQLARLVQTATIPALIRRCKEWGCETGRVRKAAEGVRFWEESGGRSGGGSGVSAGSCHHNSKCSLSMHIWFTFNPLEWAIVVEWSMDEVSFFCARESCFGILESCAYSIDKIHHTL